jgi:hypothetical protein
MTSIKSVIASGRKWSAAISLIQMKRLLRHAFLAMTLFVSSCVAPPDYSDGLLENVPAIVDETDYFSLSILGDKYTEDKEWDLSLITDSTDVLLQTLAIKELAIVSDSSFLYLIRDTGDTILAVLLLSELNWSSEDSVAYIGSPSKVIFSGNNFSGRLEYQILKK